MTSICYECAQRGVQRQATTVLTFLWIVTRWPTIFACDEHVTAARQNTPTITPIPVNQPATCGRCSAPATMTYAPVSEGQWAMNACDEHAAERLNGPPPAWCDRVVKGVVPRPKTTPDIDEGWRTLPDGRRIKLW